MSSLMTPMSQALAAEAPFPKYHERLMLFGQFVGSWHMAVRYFDRSGTTLFESDARWSFGWVLDGRAVQDVLLFEPGGAWGVSPDERGIGTTLRYYDPNQDIWRVVWLGAASGTLITLIARPRGSEIVLEGKDVDDSYIQWMFTDISDEGFRWTGHSSPDGTSQWWVEQEMIARRLA